MLTDVVISLLMSVKQAAKARLSAFRNPVYIVYALVGVVVFTLGTIIAESGAGPIEVAIFRTFNELGNLFYRPMVAVSLFGTIGMVFVASLFIALKKRYATATRILLTGLLAYGAAYGLKLLDFRARPGAVIEDANIRESASELLGYPSGHMAVATVLALSAYVYFPKKYHRYITILLLLVGVSRMYLGVHFPVDLLGGWAIGMFFAGILSFAFGSRSYSPVPVKVIKQKLLKLGQPVSSVKLASVDARGSTPYFVTFKDKSKYFLKIVGIENNIADWLFKTFRRIAYRRFEDEQPFMSPKRQLEHEAYVAMMAKSAGVLTPKIIGIFEAQPNRWGLTQEMIDGKSLDDVDPKRITNKTLDLIWQQVNILHESRIVHRDLRAANVFLANDGKPWLIDFGFSESSVSDRVLYRDTTELIASLSLLVGVDRSVASALRNVKEETLKNSLPYLSFVTLSGATTAQLKNNKGMLKEIQTSLSSKLKIDKVDTVNMKRFSLKTLLIILSFGVALHVLAPQLGSFQDSVNSAKDASFPHLGLALLLSFVTYVFSALAYMFLSIYPLKFFPTLVVQIASSFASKLGPAGTGGMALNIKYLLKNGHSAVQAGAVTAANTILGLVGHMSLLLVVTLLTRESISSVVPEIHVPRFVFIVLILGVITFGVAYALYKNLRKFLHGGVRKMLSSVSYYKENPLQLVWGYVVSIGITISYALTLFICVKAFGIDLSLVNVLYVFTIGAIVASVTPTPGGIGGTEAAYIASFTAMGVAPGEAVAVTLIFRLLTFWLPIMPGFAAFKRALNKEYI
jgi:undecaprenyl-diphosphatase